MEEVELAILGDTATSASAQPSAVANFCDTDPDSGDASRAASMTQGYPSYDIRARASTAIHVPRALGKGTIHETHVLLGAHRGVRWCNACGQYAVSHGEGLFRACPRVASRKGKAVLARLRQGLTPRKEMDWPFPDDGELVSTLEGWSPHNFGRGIGFVIGIHLS